MKRIISIVFIIFSIITYSNAKEVIGLTPKQDGTKQFGKSSGCAAATAQRDLEVNNVRTTILNGGDMWWNLSNARYEIPKVIPGTGQVSKHSLFSGALWIGGITNGNLRIAAQTYRQSGSDFFPGPLTIGTATVSQSVCAEYDKIWKVTLTEIARFREGELGNRDNATEDIIEWPAIINKPGLGFSRFLAPFFDLNGDDNYNVDDGDYPSFDQNVIANIPDMMLFWVFNDKGNIHSETQGLPIGLEIQTVAFAYSTNDEVNNMTFYRNTIYNRSNETIDSCVFGQWVDADLGNYIDDYVECDVTRNLGICYNGDDNDEGILGYGLNPPSIGVNFFEGPRRPDSSEIGLTKFVYYDNNRNPVNGNPDRPEHYWNYLNGRWKNGQVFKYGKDGVSAGGGIANSDTASFMFPGSTDPGKRPLWTERTAGNQPNDRRFLQTAGSFSLLPGAVNRVTIGVVWARASSGGATGSFNLLKQASDKAFILFKNNFKIIAGPDAPPLEIAELNRNFIIKMNKTEIVENFSDSIVGPCANRTRYAFQGYQIFQLKTASIPSDIYDQSQARLVAQFDVKDGVARLVNSIFSPELEENVKKIMVTGADEGVRHSFQITKDLFETGSDQTLDNFKDYHYVIIAYANATNCVTDPLQYLPSRKTIGRNELTVYTVSPHDPLARNGGTKVNAKYGDGLTIIQTEGVGNGGNFLNLTKECINEILASPNSIAKNRVYMPGFGPVKIKVIDPLKVPNGDFVLYMRDTSANPLKDDSLRAKATFWYLSYNGITQKAIYSIDRPNEQLFPELGISLDILQSLMPGDNDNLDDLSNGFLNSEVIYSNPSDEWISGVPDNDQSPVLNWIRSGNAGSPRFENVTTDDFSSNASAVDPRRSYSKIIEGTWAPYALAVRFRKKGAFEQPSLGPAWDESSYANFTGNEAYSGNNPLSELYGIDLVYTSDKSLWTRCVVVEAGENPAFNVGGADKMDLRVGASVDKNGKKGDGIVTSDPNDADYISATGMSWFPGYAINVETGERLNIIFSEDSSLPTENGSDMMWNPTRNFIFEGAFSFGGKHNVYVMGNRRITRGSLVYNGPRYDAGASYRATLEPTITSPSLANRKSFIWGQAMWVQRPISSGSGVRTMEQGVAPSTITYKIRIKRPYANFSSDGATVNDSMPYFTFSTKGFAPEIGADVARRALDKVNIVPNPYYGASAYESPGNQLDNQVRLVNLPAQCVIRIYTTDGVLVRTIRKDDDAAPYVIWDLKNDAQVPIASGIYLIHIKAEKLGEERIIKWFGVMRPIDFDTF